MSVQIYTSLRFIQQEAIIVVKFVNWVVAKTSRSHASAKIIFPYPEGGFISNELKTVSTYPVYIFWFIVSP